MRVSVSIGSKASISASLKGTHGCCGASAVYGFSPRQTSTLTDDEVMYLYSTLYNKLRDVTRNVLTAIDPDTDKYSGGTATSGRTGQLSLADFCRKAGFVEHFIGFNNNNGHSLAVFSDTWVTDGDGVYDEDEDCYEYETRERMEVPVLPKQEVSKEAATDIDKVVQAILAHIGE